MPPPQSLYIHWPFCERKCPYCDFNSHLQRDRKNSDFVEGLATEIRQCSDKLLGFTDKPILRTIFFGGGTPSLMDPENLYSIMDSIRSNFELAENCEVTLEANPSSSEFEKFSHFRKAGVNRLSLGIQSFNDDDLKFLGRIHTAKEAYQALEIAIKIFPEVSFDLIYALKDETVENWSNRLTEALQFNTNHLSLYQLTLEPKTLFAQLAKQGNLHLPPAELKADMYRATEEITTSAGFKAYEVSNYAKPGHESKHNLTYWNYSPYMGIGPGAHARIKINNDYTAKKRISSPDKWLAAVMAGENPFDENEVLSKYEIALEALLMGLRLQDGIDKVTFYNITGSHLEDILDPKKVKRCVEEGYLTEDKKSLRCSFEGRLRLEAILEEILV